jgi:lysine 6-dehydrogenase
MENVKVFVLGGGKIGKAVAHYLEKNKAISEIALFSDNPVDIGKSKKIKVIIGNVFDKSKTEILKNYDIIVGALPEESGREGLKLALKYKKDLIDISVVSISFYLGYLSEIERLGIRVIPGCGVSPGLTNLIVGFGMRNFNKNDEVEIGAGTLSVGQDYFFPFTWSFGDLIEEHLYRATIIKNGKQVKLAPFSGYKTEELRDIGKFESYLIEEWSTLPCSLSLKNLSFRVIRPVGFFHFFQFLKNHSFFTKKNIGFAEKLLTEKKKDNTTIIYIKIGSKSRQKKKFFWQVSSFSKRNEKLNSMQKITSLVPAFIIDVLLHKKIERKGLIFMEEIGKDENIFWEIINRLKKENIFVKNK